MALQKKKFKQLKAELTKEFTFIKKIFSMISLPSHVQGINGDNMDFEMVSDGPQNPENKELPKRAQSIAELEEKLEKIKSLNNFNLKNKLVKKSLNSKLNKKIKKRDRPNKTSVKPTEGTITKKKVKQEAVDGVTPAKPIFNNNGKLVFSKFDFSNVGSNEKPHRSLKNPKKILENLKEQEEKFKKLENNEDGAKAKEMKEKLAWKNILQKAEGEKIKDDPTLLKKTIQRMEQKKNQSKNKWDNRIKNVNQKKDDRQKKRRENILKKKKEKKSKIVKAAVKRGRVVIK